MQNLKPSVGSAITSTEEFSADPRIENGAEESYSPQSNTGLSVFNLMWM